MTLLMASIFGGGKKSQTLPTVHVAVLDQDKDMLSKMLRSLPSQGDAAKQLHLDFVETREAGIRLLEDRKASAFVVLPAEMTERLLTWKTNTIELYENPAEQILPKVVRQGVSLVAVGLSGASELLHEPLTELRNLTKKDAFPPEAAVVEVASVSLKRLSGAKTYLFPPLIQFQTISASDYIILTNTSPPSHE